MKRLLLAFTVVMLMAAGSIEATHAQTSFQTANISTYTYPDNDIPFRAFYTSCYAYGNMDIGGTLSDLYIFTWNDLGSHDIGNAGIALRRFVSGSQINQTYTTWGTEIIRSNEAVLLQQGQDVYILAAYYSVDMQGFYVNLYKYISGTIILQSGYPVNITTNGTAPFDQIRIDAHTLNDFIITWGEQGRILTKAGKVVAGGISLGNTVTLNTAANGMPQGKQPDVALIESQQGGLKAHFVYTNLQQNQLMVSSLSFSSILSAPPSASLTPTVEELQGTSGIFELPRIDAPDNFSTDDWAYVVMNSNPGAQTNKVFTGIMDSGTLRHFFLNDGSLPGSTLTDISSTNPATNHVNQYPVLAYDNTGHNLYYCWHYFSNSLPPSTLSSSAYIGLKISINGSVLGPNNQYWRAQLQPQYTSSAANIALSGQNDASPDLFMSFTQYNTNGSAAYSMGSKLIPWSNTAFRPGQGNGIADGLLKDNLQVSPNPFTSTFQLQLTDEKSNKCYHLLLTNLSGQTILSQKGTLPELNRALATRKAPGKLLPGIYSLSIRTENGQAYSFKLLKLE